MRQSGRGARPGTSEIAAKYSTMVKDGRRNGVGVILNEEYIGRVLEVKRVSDRMMYMKLDIDGVMMTVISAYAPQVGRV